MHGTYQTHPGGKCSGGEPQPATVGAFLKLVTAAMACDLTRVALVDSGQLANADFNGTSRRRPSRHRALGHSPVPPPPRRSATTTACTPLSSVTSSAQFSNAGMLDSSALMWITEIADGPHGSFRDMVVLAGGANGAFAPGAISRYGDRREPGGLQLRGRQKPHRSRSQPGVYLMPAIGLPTSDWDPVATGDLAGKGEAVNVSGPLPRLA